jgi:hypothetical protein
MSVTNGTPELCRLNFNPWKSFTTGFAFELWVVGDESPESGVVSDQIWLQGLWHGYLGFQRLSGARPVHKYWEIALQLEL